MITTIWRAKPPGISSSRRFYDIFGGALSVRVPVVAGIFLAVISPWSDAQAAEISCKEMAREVRARGTLPKVVISATGRTVLVTTKFGHCSEPISVWGTRDLTPDPAPATIKPNAPQKSAVSPDGETKRLENPVLEPAENDALATEQSPLSLPRPSIPDPTELESRPMGQFVAKCTKQIRDFWSAGLLDVEGQKFWLAKAYSIDVDSDGVTDNVGFHLRRHRRERRVTYFATGGALAGRELEGLRIDDDRQIAKLCFGTAKYVNPSPAETGVPPKKKKAPQRMFATPNLEKELETARNNPADNIDNIEFLGLSIDRKLLVALGAGFGIFSVGGGIGAFVFLRHRRKSKHLSNLSGHFGEAGSDYIDDDDLLARSARRPSAGPDLSGNHRKRPAPSDKAKR